MKVLSRIPLIVALAGASCANAQTPEAARDIDRIFDQVYERYRLPGMALGIVRQGEVIYTRTAGELIAGSGKPVTADTLFKIASNTKAMTTGTLARLVEAGKLHWDDPVTKYLPQFKMSDPWITREIQVRDLLMHNSGLREGAGDLMLWPEPNLFTRADVIAGLQYLKPQHSFRSRYDYDNLMYVVAGEVAAAAAGVPYEDLVRREVFGPLGMTRCQVGAWNRDEVGNVAQAHMREGERNVLINADEALIPNISSAPAGGVRCSLNDMLKWMRMWLDPQLRSDKGDPWLTTAQRDILWTAQMPMPLSERQRAWDGSRFNAYGYGWRLSDVDGVLRVAHTGTLSGMYSAVTLLPEKRVGFVFLINGEGADARAVLNEVLVKHFTSTGQPLPVAYYAGELVKEEERKGDIPHFPGRLAGFETDYREMGNVPFSRQPAAPAAMSKWVGTYRDPWFGEISVCAHDGRIRFVSAKSPQLSGDVMAVGERLLVDWYDASADAEPWLQFAPAGKGKAITLMLAKVDPDADFSNDYEDLFFTRTGGCK